MNFKDNNEVNKNKTNVSYSNEMHSEELEMILVSGVPTVVKWGILIVISLFIALFLFTVLVFHNELTAVFT